MQKFIVSELHFYFFLTNFIEKMASSHTQINSQHRAVTLPWLRMKNVLRKLTWGIPGIIACFPW